jgi:hypothetical protein
VEHPEGNGLAERHVAAIKTKLRLLRHTKRMSIQQALQRTTTKLNKNWCRAINNTPSAAMASLRDGAPDQQATLNETLRQITHYSNGMAARANEDRRVGPPLTSGQLVFVAASRKQRLDDPLGPRFRGPFRVVAVLGELTAVVERIGSSKQQQVINVKRLRIMEASATSGPAGVGRGQDVAYGLRGPNATRTGPAHAATDRAASAVPDQRADAERAGACEGRPLGSNTSATVARHRRGKEDSKHETRPRGTSTVSDKAAGASPRQTSRQRPDELPGQEASATVGEGDGDNDYMPVATTPHTSCPVDAADVQQAGGAL